MTKHLCKLAVLIAACFSVAGFAADSVTVPAQNVDPALRAMLPADIQKSGTLTSVNNGSFPPYEIATSTDSLEGASADLAKAMGELLGVTIHHASVSGLSGLLSGVNSGRYQLGFGPIGDYPDRQAKNTFIDFVQEFVVFAVHAGNPEKINGLEDTCGKRIAVMAGGSAEQVIRKQSTRCTEAGKPAVRVQSFVDQPTSILAVRSNRSDAFFSSQAPLIYFVSKTNGQLELAGVGKKNGFHDIFQGAVVPKDSPLSKVVLAAFQTLFDNGTYATIMKKWGLENNMIKAPGINLAKEATQ
ncbi:amino acid ABC transporter [Chimaeribacter californicus]|uniref:Amino acid ABC transporter n=1 Tax=Chimaeribacter californicus TaxID=2060067 RepID=A0A2N5EC56_9GAMM|nr:ABC transporter substrate-binding protein [Chimaeribacter californicus]PLR39690.1 amino acid ABC transporter [Chimaeribacter californicus]